MVPGDASVPNSRNHVGPSAMIDATCAHVSTLFTSVGGGSSTSAKSTGTSSTPRRYGGATRGNGGRPSSTSSSAVSSPTRYSSGPAFTSSCTSPAQPASCTSAIALSRIATSSTNDARVPITTRSAPTTNAAMSAPSSTAYGLRCSSARSLYEPGSPSAAFTTTVVGRSSDRPRSDVSHFVAVGNPAPPRPRRPAAVRSSITAVGPSLRAASSPEPLPPYGASPGRANGAAGRTRSRDMRELFPPPSCGEPTASLRLTDVSERWRDVFHEPHGMRDYDEILVPRIFGPWGEILLDTVGVDSADIALDVACGPGSVTR